MPDVSHDQVGQTIDGPTTNGLPREPELSRIEAMSDPLSDPLPDAAKQPGYPPPPPSYPPPPVQQQTDTAPPVEPEPTPDPYPAPTPDPGPEPGPMPEPGPEPMPEPGPEPMPGPLPQSHQARPTQQVQHVQPTQQLQQAQSEPRRFMTATDFLDRRVDTGEPGPATWGWRGRVRRWSGGTINPKMGPRERQHEEYRRTIQRDFQGPRTIAFINPKGGAAKTTGVLAAGYTFGTVRGGGVVAWDNNETRGTLGIRGIRGGHQNTTRELLEDLGRFTDVHQSRIGDLGAFVRSQGDAHFDVLASDERPHVTGQIHADDFNAVHALLERFYRIILVDTGNNMRAENWLAAAEQADLLVVTSTVREDTGYSGLWMLDALQDAGYANLKYKAVTVLSDPSATVDDGLARDLVDVYQQRTRAVFRVPYDPVLVSGSVVPYNRLSDDTRESWLRACAAMADAL